MPIPEPTLEHRTAQHVALANLGVHDSLKRMGLSAHAFKGYVADTMPPERVAKVNRKIELYLAEVAVTAASTKLELPLAVREEVVRLQLNRTRRWVSPALRAQNPAFDNFLRSV